jgi:hypothetical protein
MPKTLPKLTLSPRLGATHETALRISSQTMLYAQISGMAQSAPLEVTATAHGIPDGWQVAVIGAKGMTELNAADPNDIKASEYHRCTVIDVDTVTIDGISSERFKAYQSGGHLAFRAPADLSGYASGRMDVKAKVGGDILLTRNTTNGGMFIDSATSSVFVRLAPTTISGANLTAKDYVFDIELVTAGGAVDALCSADSVFSVQPEVTTSV